MNLSSFHDAMSSISMDSSHGGNDTKVGSMDNNRQTNKPVAVSAFSPWETAFSEEEKDHDRRPVLALQGSSTGFTKEADEELDCSTHHPTKDVINASSHYCNSVTSSSSGHKQDTHSINKSIHSADSSISSCFVNHDYFIDETTKAMLSSIVSDRVMKTTVNYAREDVEGDLTRLDPCEIKVGDIIGQGSFCNVHDIHDIKLINKSSVKKEEVLSRRDNDKKNAAKLLSSNKKANSSNRRSSMNDAIKNSTSSLLAETENLRVLLRTRSSRRGSFTGGSSSRSSLMTVGFSSMNNQYHNKREEDDWSDDHLAKQVHDRNYMETNAVTSQGKSKYAIKMLQKKYASVKGQKSLNMFLTAVTDLAVEVRLLTAISEHPNIIQIRAISTGNPYEFGFFFVMDRLERTLGDLIELDWKLKQRKLDLQNKFTMTSSTNKQNNSSSLTKQLKHTLKVVGVAIVSGKKSYSSLFDLECDFWKERIGMARDIAAALAHLHSLNIIYRDLKSENIGQDVNGQTKLFDFGLSRVLDPKAKNIIDGTYNMSIGCGTIRYMSPEVALGKPYNLAADVYSMSILLWQMIHLTVPFHEFSRRQDFFNLVSMSAARPKISKALPPQVSNLLETNWSPIWTERLSMEDTVTELEKMI